MANGFPAVPESATAHCLPEKQTHGINIASESRTVEWRYVCDRRYGIKEWKLRWNGNHYHKAKTERRPENTQEDCVVFMMMSLVISVRISQN